MNNADNSSISESLVQPVFHVFVPNTIATKSELLDFLGERLKFFDGWGKNWDALDDLLDDLSWIDKKTVWIEHQTFPKIGKSELGIYLDILKDAMSALREEGEKRLVFSFG